MYIDERYLEKRYFYWGCFENCNSGWYSYGRWILMGCLIALGIAMLVFVRWFSGQKVRHGQQPLPMTGWMVPPSYYQSQQQYNQPTNGDGPALPLYNQQPGADDAGYYDSHGNFISKQETDNFPPAHMRPDNTQTSTEAEGDAAGYYRPPPGPPPTTGDNYAPPSGPPPAATR